MRNPSTLLQKGKDREIASQYQETWSTQATRVAVKLPALNLAVANVSNIRRCHRDHRCYRHSDHRQRHRQALVALLQLIKSLPFADVV